MTTEELVRIYGMAVETVLLSFPVETGSNIFGHV